MLHSRYIICALAVATTFLLYPSTAAAQATPPPNRCVDWVNAQSWSGTINISGGGSYTDPNSGTQTTVSESGTINLAKTDPTIGPCNTNLSVYQWFASTPASVTNITIHDVSRIPTKDTNGNACILTETFDLDNGTSSTSPTITVDFSNPANPTFNIATGLGVEGVTQAYSGCGTTAPPAQLSTTWGPGSLTASQTSMPLPPFTNSLSLSIPTIVVPVFTGSSTSWALSGSLSPFIPPLDVVVLIPQYPTWRPDAGVSETDTGINLLGIQTRLIRTDTNQVAGNMAPDGWTFSLTKVSHEPGVAMNWPSQINVMTPAPPDLAFSEAINQLSYPTLTPAGDLTLPGNCTVLELWDPLRTPAPSLINVALSPYDWGGWAVMKVTAFVNGQQVPGHIDLDNGQKATDILLPKRQPNSFIPDSWKSSHGVLAFADDDDSENLPGTNNPNPGDGLSLYEEYRGFYADCPPDDLPTSISGPTCVGQASFPPVLRTFLHVEGDPKNLDLFVVNDSFPEVLEGIKQFQAGTGIHVCCKTLQDDEINGVASRVINFNHSEGAHNADQHAIVIVKGADGAPPCTQNGPDKPQNIPKIFYPSMANVLSIASKEGGQARAVWAADKYPYSVAHEIGHAIAVSHHGTHDAGYTFWSTSDGVSLLEGPLPGAGTPIQAVFEDGKPVKPSDLGIKAGGSFKIWVGHRGEQHSGDVMCFMRYNVAQSYCPLGDPTCAGNQRFYVPERELAGRSMTNKSEGTGTNDPGRTNPQTRYGNADGANNFGMCKFQICVNDRLTPKVLVPSDGKPCPRQTNP